MRKFIINLIIFLFPLLILIISTEVALRKIPNDYSFKKNYLDKNSNKIEILILGSSHTYYGIDPKYIKAKSFNAAYISQSINYDLAILKKYKSNLKNVKYIIVPVDYFTMFSTLEGGIEKWRVKNYNIYFDINENIKFSDNFELTNGKLSSNIDRIKQYYLKHEINNITSNELGWGTNHKAVNSLNLDETGKLAAKRHTNNIKDNLDYKKNTAIVNSLLQIARSLNAKIIFITCPAYKTYVQNLDNIQLNATINFLDQISKNNSQVTYFNFLNDKSFGYKDFYDADHLNEIGAKKLSLKIDSIIKLDNRNLQLN